MKYIPILFSASPPRGGFFYFAPDYPGSITQLLYYDDNGDLKTRGRFGYDAWGRLREVDGLGSWTYDISTSTQVAFGLLDRGYTGHEHLLDHQIINMNGRIYDPLTGAFMQPDNHIQTPEDFIGYDSVFCFLCINIGCLFWKAYRELHIRQLFN